LVATSATPTTASSPGIAARGSAADSIAADDIAIISVSSATCSPNYSGVQNTNNAPSLPFHSMHLRSVERKCISSCEAGYSEGSMGK
jgi:hypothetical protein